ncbi:MAG: hypothetical protein ACFCU8_10230 [Thermosynechococcaceae cyanobacterium]
MKVNYLAMVAAVSILGVGGLITSCSETPSETPAADTTASPEAQTDPCAAKTDPCAAKTDPCAAKTDPCAAKTDPCAAKTDPCAAKTP